MLVLSAKMGESIRIADNISVTILRVRGARVRVGINAPPEIKIARKPAAPMRPRPSGRPDDPETPVYASIA